MRNTLVDLNNYLFAQIERLDDESLSKDALEREVVRGKAISDIAKTIVDNARYIKEKYGMSEKQFLRLCGTAELRKEIAETIEELKSSTAFYMEKLLLLESSGVSGATPGGVTAGGQPGDREGGRTETEDGSPRGTEWARGNLGHDALP